MESACGSDPARRRCEHRYSRPEYHKAMADELKRRFPGAGGTPGGLGEFFTGLVMAVVGGYLILNQVTVTTGFWAFWGYNTFGLTLVPLLVGIRLAILRRPCTAGMAAGHVWGGDYLCGHHRQSQYLFPSG
jgi:hypothetical protein